MARPLKEGMDYFPHDTDASNDEKIEALRALYGNDGYAFYFILLERIYRTPDAELDISKPALKAALIMKVGVTPAKFEEMLLTAFDIECLDREAYEEHGKLTSNGVKRRHEEVKCLRESWRTKRKLSKKVISGDNHGDNHGVISGDNHGDNPVITPQSKVKESKVKESIKDPNNNDNARARDEINFVKTYEQEFGRLISPTEYETLQSFASDGMDETVICEAIKRTRLQGKTNVSYTKKILVDWLNKGVLDLNGVSRVDLKHQNRARDRPKGGTVNARAGPDIQQDLEEQAARREKEIEHLLYKAK